MDVLISIVTPVYNAEKFLRRTEESVRSQGVENWEWLLVDDGSSDDSGRLCDDLAKQDPRIKVFHLPNGGPGKAKDHALSHCSGKFVTSSASGYFSKSARFRLSVSGTNISSASRKVTNFPEQ